MEQSLDDLRDTPDDPASASPYRPPDLIDDPELQRAGSRQTAVIGTLSIVCGTLVTIVLVVGGSFLTLYLGWHVAYFMLGIGAGPALGILAAMAVRRIISWFLGVRTPHIHEESNSLRQRLEVELVEFQRNQSRENHD